MKFYPYNPTDQRLKTDAKGIDVDRAFIAHFHIDAADAVAASVNGVHAARTCPAVHIPAYAIVAAATAVTDILTITAPQALGAAPNALSIKLETNSIDTLAVSAAGAIITIKLANATAAKNTAALIQAAIRGIATGLVSGVDITGFTCAAGGNWDAAAVATGTVDAVTFTHGVTAANDVLTTNIASPVVPRNITAKPDGTQNNIGAIAVIIEGTNFNNEVITETLPAFTANNKTGVVGNLAFKTVKKITIPPHVGTGATTAIGWGEKFGLPYLLYADELAILKLFDKAIDAATVVADATDLEKNTFDLAGTPDGLKDIDIYLLV